MPTIIPIAGSINSLKYSLSPESSGIINADTSLGFIVTNGQRLDADSDFFIRFTCPVNEAVSTRLDLVAGASTNQNALWNYDGLVRDTRNTGICHFYFFQ
jgi:hypothetical protein